MLRRAESRDLPCIAALRRDIALQHLLLANPDPQPVSNPIEDARDWVSRRENAGAFRIVDDGNGAQGFIQIAEIHRKNRLGWFGLALLPSARGRGLGAQALVQSETMAWKEYGLRKLLLYVRADNAAAIRLYQTAGWSRVGLMRSHYDDGTVLHDVLMFEKLQGDEA